MASENNLEGAVLVDSLTTIRNVSGMLLAGILFGAFGGDMGEEFGGKLGEAIGIVGGATLGVLAVNRLASPRFH